MGATRVIIVVVAGPDSLQSLKPSTRRDCGQLCIRLPAMRARNPEERRARFCLRETREDCACRRWKFECETQKMEKPVDRL